MKMLTGLLMILMLFCGSAYARIDNYDGTGIRLYTSVPTDGMLVSENYIYLYGDLLFDNLTKTTANATATDVTSYNYTIAVTVNGRLLYIPASE